MSWRNATPTPRPTHGGTRRETARPAESSPSAVAEQQGEPVGQIRGDEAHLFRPASAWSQTADAAARTGSTPWASKAVIAPASTSPVPAVASAGPPLATTRTGPSGSATIVVGPLWTTTAPIEAASSRVAAMGRWWCGRRAGRTHRRAGSHGRRSAIRIHRGTRAAVRRRRERADGRRRAPWPHRHHGRAESGTTSTAATRSRSATAAAPHAEAGSEYRPPRPDRRRRRAGIAICT